MCHLATESEISLTSKPLPPFPRTMGLLNDSFNYLLRHIETGREFKDDTDTVRYSRSPCFSKTLLRPAQWNPNTDLIEKRVKRMVDGLKGSK